MLIASSDTVNLPNKRESPLPKWGSDIRTGNFFGFSVIYSRHNLQILCAGLKSHPAMESSGRDWGRCEHFGVSPHCSPMPGQQQSWALQPGLCSSSTLAGTSGQTGRAGSKANALAQFAGSNHNWGAEKHPSPCAPGCWQQSREFRGASQGE